jgi:hypothetical protein
VNLISDFLLLLHEDEENEQANMSREQQLKDLKRLVLLSEVCDELEEEEKDADTAAAAGVENEKRTWAKDYLLKRDQLDG